MKGLAFILPHSHMWIDLKFLNPSWEGVNEHVWKDEEQTLTDTHGYVNECKLQAECMHSKLKLVGQNVSQKFMQF